MKCVILAPTTMLTQQGKRIKTDMRDLLDKETSGLVKKTGDNECSVQGNIE
jgi:hypothetical protein